MCLPHGEKMMCVFWTAGFAFPLPSPPKPRVPRGEGPYMHGGAGGGGKCTESERSLRYQHEIARCQLGSCRRRTRLHVDMYSCEQLILAGSKAARKLCICGGDRHVSR